MSSVKVQAPVATTPASGAAPTVEAEHLRRIVEKQPACLMRVGIDGLILAANDAALGLFGAQEPADVLGGLLTKWIVPSHHGAWKEFSRTVSAGISQSVECDVTPVSGPNRSVVFHGVPLVDHADGIPSLILGARDASALRRLEIALQESEAIRQKLAAEPTPLAIETVSVELRDLQAKLDEAEADRDRLERALSRLPQLEQLLKQGKTHLQDLRTRLEDATNERNRLAAQLNEREASNEQLWGEQAELQQALADKQQRELDELHARLQDANATRDAVAARLHAREIEHDQLVAEHKELRLRYDDLRSEHEQAQQSIETRQQELGVLGGKLAETIAEKDNLVTQLADRIGEHERALTEHERALSSQADRHLLEVDKHQQVLAALRADLEQATADRDRLSGQLSDLESTHERYVKEHSELNRLLDDHRRQLGDLRSQFEETAGDRDRFAEQLRDAETYCQQLSNDHSAERARHTEERTRLEDATAAAIAQQKASEKTLADHRIELQSMDLAARRIEPLAAAGRLALDIARELVTAVADIDARAACLVAECPVDSSNREEVEQLRADAVRAASLARQILQANHLNHSEELK
jgi:chromosome segregation ATPase